MPYARTITPAETCSNCVSTGGKKENCNYKVSGGNKKVLYFANRCDIDTISIDTDGIVDDITLVGGASFYSVVAQKDTLTWTESATFPNKFITQTVVFNVTQLSDNADKNIAYQEASEFAQEFINADGEYVFIIQTRLGVWRIFGADAGMEISAGENISGAAIADVSANTLTFVAGEPEYAHVVDPVVVAGLPII